ncbi:hypothetical protein WMY93_014960 [Mugilogobius chulae]|uniref:SPIN-DOC-like zinc-finger domain-containing protein n=1 Tax=Mugilogobius chulae TaxID=88201 RepID=A0AAW0NW43_9GOBI
MPTVKGKGSPTGHRYTPVSEFDNATLAQKREYWRNKKREQRARRTTEKKRTTPKPNLSSLAHASSFPLQNKNGSNLAAINIDSLQTKNRASSGFAAIHDQKQQVYRNASANSGKIVVKCTPQENTAVNSVLINQLNSSISVPTFNSKPLQPYVSLQGSFIPKTSQNQPILIQPKPTTNIATKSTPQLPTKSALVIQQKPTNASPAKAETEEEKAAKRRELWRIRKREQRAKLAARLGKTKSKAQNVQKQHPSNGVSIHIPTSNLLQSGPGLVKIPNLQTNIATTFQTGPPLVVVKRPFEPMRKNPSPFHLSGVLRARCPTPRQNVVKQRLLKLKSPAVLCGSKGLPPIDPNDTPEQVIAKRREYWRVKKREQRAKLSVDVKLRLKEKDDFQHRVKRYHKILEDMRKARTQTIMHASETIGGFIKEDGTVTINIPQVTVNFGTPAQRREDVVDTYSTQPRTSKHLQSFLPQQVKNSNSLLGQQPRPMLMNKSLGIACSSSQIRPIRAQGSHLMLTPASQNQGTTARGCVMKMAVSCKVPSTVKAYLDPSLTEEERMAKRREYWRVKKREQRAARTVRLRQGHSQTRVSAVLLKRKAQKHVAGVPLNRRLPKHPGSVANNVVAYVNEMKQEGELMPAVDLNFNQAICAELKHPMSRTTPPPAQVEHDPALSADSQATTLLAVASMKKLLEESLSGVSECQPEIKTEETEEEEEKVEQQDVKPDVALDNVCAPITADVTSQTESGQADTKINEQHVSFEESDTSQMTPSVIPLCAGDKTPETPAAFIVNPKIELSDGVQQRRTQRAKKAGQQQQQCCLPGPPKLHHPPAEMHIEPGYKNHIREKCPQVMTLDQKREYWKLMKRQQRARLKARQRGSSSNNVGTRNIQSSSGCMLNKRAVIKPSFQPKLPSESVRAAPSMPSVLLVSPTVANAGPQGTLRVKSPVCSRVPEPSCRRINENANFPTIKPPENPLSSVNVQPAESRQRSVTIPSPQKQNNAQYVASRSIGTIVPPKPIPGESEEDFQKRKREYWRVKKKEQRARKAFQDKDKSPVQAAPKICPITCRRNLYKTTVSSNSADSDVDSFPFPNYSVPIGEGNYYYYFLFCIVMVPHTTTIIPLLSDGVFSDYESAGGEEASLSGDFWRNHYLMDHDPLNQLLVCMGVRGHIEEAHPHTLNLEPGERHRILQAWDEQVFHRERFFTNQLQQHSTSMTEAHMN